MSKYINHEEAYSYVSAHYHTSNIARCYLNLREQRNELLEALEEVIAISDRKHDVWDKAKQAIAKAKGEV